jgi:glycosyltransferase involved in cell wall biosynthesis
VCPLKLQNIINKQKNIIFKHGTFSPFPYHEGDIYLYPSRLDGIGLTLPEAISMGLPAIVTNCPPMNEFVKDNYNGFLIDVKYKCSRPDGYYWPESICSKYSLKEKIEKYIKNPNLVNIHSQGSRDLALNQLKWEENSKNLSRLISEFKKKEIDLNKFYQLCSNQDRKDAPSPFELFSMSIKNFTRQFYNYINKV